MLTILMLVSFACIHYCGKNITERMNAWIYVALVATWDRRRFTMVQVVLWLKISKPSLIEFRHFPFVKVLFPFKSTAEDKN